MTKRSALVLAVVLAGVVAIDAVAEHARAPAPVAQPARGGVSLSCPLAVDGASRSFVHVANVGTQASRAKLTTIGANAKVFRTTFGLEPGEVSTVRVSGRVAGRAAALIEATGGEVVASHSLWFRAERRTGLLQRLVHPRGGAAAPCGSAGAGELVLPHLTTRDADTRLAVFNPGAATSTVSISLIAGNRIVRPERLQNRLVESRSMRMFSLGGFVFNADEVTAVVRQETGRVAADALVIARDGVALVAGTEAVPAPLAIAGATGAGATIGLAALGDADAGIAASVLGRQDQGRARGIPPDLPPSNGALRNAPPVDGGGPAAFQLEATIGGPLTLGMRWRAGRGGIADLESAGHVPPSMRWGAVFGSVVGGARSRLVVANPNATPVSVTIKRFGDSAAGDRRVSIPGGRVRIIGFGGNQASTAAILLEADGPVAALVQALVLESSGGLRTAYGFALEASSLDRPAPVPLTVDPRAGVPAPLPSQ